MTYATGNPQTTKVLESSFSYDDEVLIRTIQPALIVWGNTKAIHVNISVAALPAGKLEGMRVSIGDRDCTNLRRLSDQALGCTIGPFDTLYDTPLAELEDPPTVQLSIDGHGVDFAEGFVAPVFVAKPLDRAQAEPQEKVQEKTKDAQIKAISTSERYLMQGLGLAAAVLCIAGLT